MGTDFRKRFSFPIQFSKTVVILLPTVQAFAFGNALGMVLLDGRLDQDHIGAACLAFCGDEFGHGLLLVSASFSTVHYIKSAPSILQI